MEDLGMSYHAPDGYWDGTNEQRKKHRYVGKKAFINGRIHECIRAEDDLVIFKITDVSEMIISGYDDVMSIKWINT